MKNSFEKKTRNKIFQVCSFEKIKTKRKTTNTDGLPLTCDVDSPTHRKRVPRAFPSSPSSEQLEPFALMVCATSRRFESGNVSQTIVGERCRHNNNTTMLSSCRVVFIERSSESGSCAPAQSATFPVFPIHTIESTPFPTLFPRKPERDGKTLHKRNFPPFPIRLIPDTTTHGAWLVM